jgi:hypothetical protein
MKERRSGSRQKSFLQGRIYYNNRRSTVDCLVRDLSEAGAKLKFSETIAVPEAMELYIPNREEMHRARVEWRSGNELGVSFGEAAAAGTAEPAPGDLTMRVQKLELEIITLKRMLNELRNEGRKAHEQVA